VYIQINGNHLLSVPTNPASDPVAPPESQAAISPDQPATALRASPPTPQSELISAAEPLAPRGPTENPPWSGWEVVALAAITFVTIVVCVLAVAVGMHHWTPHTPWVETLTRPEVIVGGQLLAYVFILALMYKIVSNHSPGRVGEAIRWNWPFNWRTYLMAGVGLELALLPFAYLLPMPPNLPIDQFFRTARDAYILSLFGILFAPLIEELFFRGFLYPVLARRLGVPLSVFLTAIAFASIHASQLKYSWGPVLVIFLVGIALTTVRALKKSVAATVLMHMAYNATIFAAAFVATGGFRHMEKFNQ